MHGAIEATSVGLEVYPRQATVKEHGCRGDSRRFRSILKRSVGGICDLATEATMLGENFLDGTGLLLSDLF